MAKLQAYSHKIRQIPVYIAQVVLDLRQKWDCIELGIQQGDWTIHEGRLAKETVQLLWEEQYRGRASNDMASQKLSSGIDTGEGIRAGIMEEAEEHHRLWQAKRRRVTPALLTFPFTPTLTLYISLNILFYLIYPK